MNDSERRELLKRLGASDVSKNDSSSKQQPVAKPVDIDDEMVMKHTVAEAVAAAKAQENSRNEMLWEKNKKSLIEEVERATTARIKSELAIQKQRELDFAKWKEQVDAEKAAMKTISSDSTEEPSSSVVANAVMNDAPHGEENPTATALIQERRMEEQPFTDHHPVLGRCLVDLGYKRVHITTAHALSAIPVWKKQRIYRHDRAKTMAADKAKTMHLGLPGVIGLHEDGQGKLSILDGQHRVGMFTILAAKNEYNNEEKTKSIFDRILVEVYPQQEQHGETHAQDIFLEVNKAEPVKLVDMPGIAKSSDRKLLTDAAEKLSEQYRDMFSSSQKCRPPHLNLDNLRDALFAANVIARHSIKTSRQLEEWMIQQNEALAEKYAHNRQAQSMVATTALAKATKYHFYLGLESSWYYN